ncbi:hypothetical protein U1Q18_001706, partial [Sarracenia purpurea var. burkii]
MKHAWENSRSLRRGKLRTSPAMSHEQEQPSRKGLFHQNHRLEIRSDKPRASHIILPTVEAKEINDVWLKSCVVGIVKEHIEVEVIQEAMATEGV